MNELTSLSVVKFDSEQLPPILNALETDNNGLKLTLEVAVRKKLTGFQGGYQC